LGTYLLSTACLPAYLPKEYNTHATLAGALLRKPEGGRNAPVISSSGLSLSGGLVTIGAAGIEQQQRSTGGKQAGLSDTDRYVPAAAAAAHYTTRCLPTGSRHLPGRYDDEPTTTTTRQNPPFFHHELSRGPTETDETNKNALRDQTHTPFVPATEPGSFRSKQASPTTRARRKGEGEELPTTTHEAHKQPKDDTKIIIGVFFFGQGRRWTRKF
jgi:hypothetical protein